VGDVSRRDLLRALVAGSAGAVAACSGRPESRSLTAVPVGWNQGEETWINSSCGQCPAGCGIRVRVVEGRAVKIDGYPDHPINGGGLGPKGQAGLQLLYHPDRIQGPLRRVGPRGAGNWSQISWESAISEIAPALQRLRARLLQLRRSMSDPPTRRLRKLAKEVLPWTSDAWREAKLGRPCRWGCKEVRHRLPPSPFQRPSY